VNKIKILSHNLINKIAAGEVIERPASILKELVENSIDSGAHSITVKIENGGLSKITVIDDGIGIPEDEIVIAIARHSTSKITKLEDLENIQSLGFRGEALNSIAAVADLTIHSYRKNSIPTIIEVSNGKTINKETKARNIGTTVIVSDIFKYIPARKKFLSSVNTEYKHIYETFINLALSRPDINFKLFNNDKEIKNLLHSNDLQRIGDIFGEQISNKLIQIFYNSPKIKLDGYIGNPSLASDYLPKQYIFLNKRPIKEKTIYVSIKDAFGSSIPRDRKPSYFIYISIDPKQVDVNVHPRKIEVKFTNTAELYKCVKQACQTALQKFLRVNFNSSAINIVVTKGDTTVPRIYKTTKLNKINNLNPQYLNNKKNQIKKSIDFTKNILSNKTNNESIIAFSNLNLKNSATYIGQIFNTYLIFENENEILIIDQHAADERINYENVESRLMQNKKIESKPLLLPYTFELKGLEKETLLKQLESLNKFGLTISKLSGNTFQLNEVPIFISKSDIDKVIRAVINDITEHEESKISISQFQNKLLATIVCHGSIRAGDKIDRNQAYKILSDLLKCKLPNACPHGRPIMWKLSRHYISKNFERK